MLNFLVSFYAKTLIMVALMLVTVFYSIFGSDIPPCEALHRARHTEKRLFKDALRVSLLWTFCVLIASMAEATQPLIKWFAEVYGHETPVSAAIATNIAFAMTFFAICDGITTVSVELRIRHLATKCLNEGKK